MATQTDHSYALPAGSIVHQIYQIQKTLGSGSFGITYLAQHIHLGSYWVLKECLPMGIAMRQYQSTWVQAISPDRQPYFQAAFEGFFNEAQILHGLSHPNIIEVNNLFKENNTAYFVMPYKSGETLWSWINQHHAPTLDELRRITYPILDGLQYLHEQSILHRDIKPANILLLDNLNPMLIDFGSARWIDTEHPMTKLLTEHFAPPEQYDGSHYSPALDIYSLSATLYQTITRELPVVSTERLLQDTQPKLAEQGIYLRKYPQHWLQAIDKGLSVNHQDRFQSAKAMRQYLESGDTPNQPKTQQIRKNTSSPSSTTYHSDKNIHKNNNNHHKNPSSSLTGSLKHGVQVLTQTIKLGITTLMVGIGAWYGYPVVKNYLDKPPVNKPYKASTILNLNGQSVKYTGWLYNGIAEDNTGTAQLEYPNGTKCTISMKNNQRHGKGTCTYPKGSVYEGDWKNDKRSGMGTYHIPSGDIKNYVGEYADDKLNGKGRFNYRNGAVFVGKFKNGDIAPNSDGEITGMTGMAVRCAGKFTKNTAKCHFKQGKSDIYYEGGHKAGLWQGEGIVKITDNGEVSSHYEATFNKGDIVGDTRPIKTETPEVPTIQPENQNTDSPDDSAAENNTIQNQSEKILQPAKDKLQNALDYLF